MEALELSQKEYYDAMSFQGEHKKLKERLELLEKKEDELEIENANLRDKITEQDKRIKDLKEIEAKYNVEESMRKKFEMMLDRHDKLLEELKEKEKTIDRLSYIEGLMKKNKEAFDAALTNARNDNMRLEQKIINLNDELKQKEQEINDLDKIAQNLKN